MAKKNFATLPVTKIAEAIAEQVTDRPNLPSMELKAMVKAVEIAIQCVMSE